MCGISGIVAPDAGRFRAAVERMNAVLAHRGPDGSGVQCFERCILGHRRLSIVDLDTGHQPMLSADARTAVTFNGEIYGFQRLKDELDGYPFSTSSDTEVLLALYQRYGRDCLSRLPGMFAFALWDSAGGELFCARDRFGEKPFYYAFGPGGEFVFASELKALLASGLVEPILSRGSVAHYCRHLYVHPHRTIYQNVHTLPPAHMLSLRDGTLTVRRYWDIPEVTEGISPDEAVLRFRDLFQQSVGRQLVADVPLGLLLSGGLDSSSVVAAASSQRSNLRTFSFGFGDGMSELPFARQIADRYQTEHLALTARDEDLAGLLTTMQMVYDEPFADSSNIPTYLISKLSREHVKVVLSGDGGDELLGGYRHWYRPLLFLEKARTFSPARSLLILLAGRLRARADRHDEELQLVRAGIHAARRHSTMCDAHDEQTMFFTDEELARLGLQNGSAVRAERYREHSWRMTQTVRDAMLMDTESYLPGDILVKTDRASMANGLEMRTPFLDVEFASFCLSLPTALKVTRESDKTVLRHAYGAAWTEDIRRRGKQGFAAPVSRWLSTPGLMELRRSYLDDPGRRVFDVLSYEESRAYAVEGGYRTWILLVLAMWCETHSFRVSAEV